MEKILTIVIIISLIIVLFDYARNNDNYKE